MQEHTSPWDLCLLGMKDGALVEKKEGGPSPPALGLGFPCSALCMDRCWDSIKNSYLRNYLFVRSPWGLQSWKIFSTRCLCWMYKRMSGILLL